MLARYTDGQGRPLKQREALRETRGLAQSESLERREVEAFLTLRAARTVTQELDASLGSGSRFVHDRRGRSH